MAPFPSLPHLTPQQSLTILQLTSIFENSTKELQYDYCENIGDGRGYTSYFFGACTGTYDATMVAEEYNRLKPNNPFSRKFLPILKAIDRKPHPDGKYSGTEGLEDYPSVIKEAVKDPTFIQAQINVANKLYGIPSQNLAQNLGLTTPIARGQLYDAFINHGESGVLDIARRVSIKRINNIQDEKKFLDEFLKQRSIVLSRDATWSMSTDRVKVYQRLLDANNTHLTCPFDVLCYGDHFTLINEASTPHILPRYIKVPCFFPNKSHYEAVLNVEVDFWNDDIINVRVIDTLITVINT